MRKISIIILILLSLSFLFSSEKRQKTADFELTDSDGNIVKLSEVNDKLVLIDFWATWCTPCKKALPHLSNLQTKFDGDLIVLAINIDKPRHKEKAKAYVKSNGYVFTHLFDPEQMTMKMFNVTNPPRTILVAPGMEIVYTHDGYKRGDEVELEEQVLKWIDYKPEAEAVTEKSDFFINGLNEMQYVYRAVEDSLHHFIDNEFSFAANYNKFRFGMKYRGELPEYNRFSPDANLQSDNIFHEWVERYAEYNGDHFSVRAGNYETVFGSGMVIHAYNNTDMNEDERLDGVQARVKYDGFSIQGIYGSLMSETSTKDDIVTGADVSARILKPLTLGGSALSYRTYIDGIDYEYNQRDAFSGRMQFASKMFELSTEYAVSKKYRDLNPVLEGTALYANMNVYLGKFRITTAYKDYEDFNNRLVELPTANYCEEPIAEYGAWSQPGYDEEGVQGIISWTPSEKMEVTVNYSEGWAENADVDQSDFYGSLKKEFENWSLHVEYKQMERMDYSSEEYRWDKEMTPHIEIDFLLGEKPMLAKVEWKNQQYDTYGHEHGYYEPLFQLDYGFYKNYSVSAMSSFKYADDAEISSAKGKLGVELFAPVWENTDIRLFVGSEKGGKVCRNGVCNYQSPFDGVRLDVTTRF